MMAQEVVRVASETVRALKSSPASLALVVVNVTFLLFASYILSRVGENTRAWAKDQHALLISVVNQRCAPAPKED